MKDSDWNRWDFCFHRGVCVRGFFDGVSRFAASSTTDNGIPYVSGGFGMDERENLRAMSKDDNLELSFAAQNENYLGGAKIFIKKSL